MVTTNPFLKEEDYDGDESMCDVFDIVQFDVRAHSKLVLDTINILLAKMPDEIIVMGNNSEEDLVLIESRCHELEAAICDTIAKYGEIKTQDALEIAEQYPLTQSTARKCGICRKCCYPSESLLTNCGHIVHIHCIFRSFAEHSRRLFNKARTWRPCPTCGEDIYPHQILETHNGFLSFSSITKQFSKGQKIAWPQHPAYSAEDTAIDQALDLYALVLKLFTRCAGAIDEEDVEMLYVRYIEIAEFKLLNDHVTLDDITGLAKELRFLDIY